MWDISRPDVLQNCGINNYIQHLLCTRGYMSIFLDSLTQKLTYIFIYFLKVYSVYSLINNPCIMIL